MSAAPNWLGQTQTINITINGQAQQPDIVLTGGLSDSITFNNLAPFPVDIEFVSASGTVFNDITIPANQRQTSPQSPQQTQITVNYNIYNHNSPAQPTGGPYGIQVGVGTPANPAPLLIPISGGSPAPDQATISVPNQGWIKFNNQDQVSYEITWDPPAPPAAFNTPVPPNTFGPGMSNAYQAKLGLTQVAVIYTLTSVGQAPAKGTVKINA